ncbi:MAG: hypothetical protein IT547_13495 [Hyphomonadaceae bacterium]|nr:hypothetical protein [Hyphomonadaceae bacterium]
MTKHALIMTALAIGFAAAPGLAFAEDVTPPYLYYVVPCDSPGAIPAAPADTAAPSAYPTTCVVPVATGVTAPPSARRYSRYYDGSYYASPYYGSVGVTYFGAHHASGGHFRHGYTHHGGGRRGH